MPEFSRIVRDGYLLDKAHIRDTGIDIDEIVSLSKQDKSLVDILLLYPALDAEDVFQALAYSEWRVTEVFRGAVINLRDSATTVTGTAGLLSDVAVLDEAMRTRFVKSNYRAGKAIEHELLYFGLWTLQRNNSAKSLLRETNWLTLQENIKYSTQYLAPGLELSDIRIEMDEALSSCKIKMGGYSLSVVIGFLIGEWRNPVIRVRLEGETLYFEITAENPDGRPDERFLYSVQRVPELVEIILKEYRIELKVHEQDRQIKYEFTVPIWNNDDRRVLYPIE